MLVRGCKDIIKNFPIHQHVIQTMHEITDSFGFQQIKLPTLEFTDLFRKSLGQSSDIVLHEMFLLQDNKICLRPEGTAGALRAFLSESQPSLPIRWKYHGSMFRHERPQHGRLREFTQFGIETFSNQPHWNQDIEILTTGYQIIKKLGIADQVVLEINNIGTPADRKEYGKILYDHFKDSDNPKVQEKLKHNPILILDVIDLPEGIPSFRNFINEKSLKNFEETKQHLDSLKIPFKDN